MSEPGPLAALAVKYGSDKWGHHSYTTHYENHLMPYRDRPITLFEIGVGGYDDPHAGGSSLKMWTSYFPLAAIAALDIVDKSPHATDRIRIYTGSQTDEVLLKRIHDDMNGFDIIIDDGSHDCRHVIRSFEILFPLLKLGGIYIVEDIQTSYWPVFSGSSSEPDSTSTSMGYFKNLLHGLNHSEIIQKHYKPGPFDKLILSMHFYHNLIFIYKGENTEPSNVPHDHPVRRPG